MNKIEGIVDDHEKRIAWLEEQLNMLLSITAPLRSKPKKPHVISSPEHEK